MENPSEPIKVLYKLHETTVDGLKEHGYTNEEAFWYGFVATSLYIWDSNSKIEIKLSEILRLYLTIYCEKIDVNMDIEDEPIFLELLKEKYKQIHKILSESEDVYSLSKKLSYIIHGEKSNIIKQAMDITVLDFAHSKVPIPFRLINDV